jgi:restriction system protein
MTTTPVHRTGPAHRIRPVRRGRAFDLRWTALFFALLALVLVGLGLTARTAVRAAEHRPVLAVALCLVALSSALALLRGRRRFSARRAARRAVGALEEVTTTAVGALEEATTTALDTMDAVDASEPPPAARAGVPYTAVEHTAVDYDVLDADEFEWAVAALCERDGCADVEVVGGAGDLGADVVATAPDGRRVVIQCKRYGDTHKVGSQDLQRFGGTCFTVHGAEVAAVVTTSDFTAPATEYAEQCGILCVDRRALRAWSDGTGPEPWHAYDRGRSPAGRCPAPGAPAAPAAPDGAR